MHETAASITFQCNRSNFKKIVVVLISFLAAVSTGSAQVPGPQDRGGDCKNKLPQFIYVTLPNQNSVVAYSVTSTNGALGNLIGTYNTGAAPLSSAIDGKSGSIYIANQNGNSISQFALRRDGTLVPLNPAIVPTGSSPFKVIVDPSGKAVYTADIGSGNPTGSGAGGFSKLEISNDGSLQPAASTAVQGRASHSITITPNGRYAYIANGNLANVSQYRTDKDGWLISLDPATVASLEGPYSLVTDQRGNFLYVANVGASSSQITQYAIGNRGILTPLSPPSVDGGYRPNWVATHPAGQLVYSTATNQIRAFQISPDGTLQQKFTIPTTNISPSYSPVRIYIEPSGKFAYVIFEVLTTIAVYNIGTDGSLSPSAPFLQSMPSLPIDIAFGCDS